ncbi:MAG: DEAD/DEAH box helicase [Acidimicrobiales bacterium]
MTTDESGVPQTFEELGLGPELLATLNELGYEEPTPIQAEALPTVLAGRDVLGQAATGTGKTAAFALPLLEMLSATPNRGKSPVGLVLTPTRELAIQVCDATHRYGRGIKARVLPIYGGQPIQRQLRALNDGVDIVVATPGRALDHIKRGTLKLDNISMVVLDEADEMLDMGFAEDLEAILSATPKERQTVLFSATMPRRIDDIARRHQKDPVQIRIKREESTSEGAPLVRQVAYIVNRGHKAAALGRVLDVEAPAAAIVFCRTRNEVDQSRDPQRARLPSRGASRRTEPGSARPGHEPPSQQGRRSPHRYRRCGPWPRRRSPHPRRQLRRAVVNRVLRSPHRPGWSSRP